MTDYTDAVQAIQVLSEFFDVSDNELFDIILDGFGMKHKGNIPEELEEVMNQLYDKI